ncbi:MAG: hypothetical protein AAF581_20965 [Planctomycetota bacterium]
MVLCSDEFGPLGRAESEVLGLAGLPLVPIPHPLADTSADLVAAKAAGIVDDVVAALTGDAEAIRAEHAGRFVRLTQRRLEGGAVCVDDVCAIDFALDPAAAPGA